MKQNENKIVFENIFRMCREFILVRKIILSLELGTVVFVLLAAIFIAPYANVHWPNSGWIGAGTLLLSGLILTYLLIYFNWKLIKHTIVSVATRIGLINILMMGVISHIVVAIITDPILVSDPRAYLALGERLARGLEYVDAQGYRAFWPPGLPIYLTPFVFIFGANWLAVTVSNTVLYMIGAGSAWSLGTRIFDRRVGTVAALLFTIWPSHLLTAAVPKKENLTVAMILAGSNFCVAAFSTSGRKGWAFAVGAGGAFGIAALAQPGLLLFAVATPIIYRGFLGASVKTFIARCVVVIASTVICIAPWNVRNFIVFDGEFWGVSTNGGSVFYRANNPKATGMWIPEGEVPITHLPELEQNRLGFDLGKQWIRENPSDFIKLSVKKFMYLVRDDVQGAYLAILRGGGWLSDEDARRQSSVTRIWIYRIAAWLSLVFWLMISAWSVKAILEHRRSWRISGGEYVLPLIYPLLYSAAIFSVFESGTRQRTMAEGVLLVFAASFLVASKSPLDTSKNPLPMAGGRDRGRGGIHGAGCEGCLPSAGSLWTPRGAPAGPWRRVSGCGAGLHPCKPGEVAGEVG